MQVSHIMTRKVITVAASSTFMSMQQIFETEAFHHLLVEENGLLVGVISDRDIMSNITHQLRKKKLRIPQVVTAAEVMTRKIITVDSDTPIQTASILLLENNISCLPVVNDDYMIEGILTWKDILRYYIYNT